MADTIALIGGETLLGREIRDVIGASALGQMLRLVASDADESGVLTQIGGSAAFLAKLEPDAVEDAAVLILAGSPESAKTALDARPQGLIIDLTTSLDEDPEGRIRAPMAESEDFEKDLTGPQILAHPAAIAIATILKRVNANWPVSRSIVHIFHPVSEQGAPGIDELQEQTVNLLALQPLPKKVFDTQVSFAMLAQLGDAALIPLQSIEDRIERHLASLLERLDNVPMPSLKLLQAPVFHGYSFSFWLEFEDSPTAGDLEDTLTGEPFDLRAGGLEPPNNVDTAGQSGIAVGAITPDRNSANALWLWAAVDNLRLAAENTALLAAEAV